ncbi:MAG: hypothetical protein BGO54_04070 [Sphingobacteriales bacterium 46-32]|nr:MAG: hypothetical protein BGO54_04070 [Sphingobacteriales bacterium 46-32]
MIKVLGICKNSIFIKGIQPYLATHNIEIIGTCNNSTHGQSEYLKLNPDIVLRDASWAGNFYTVSETDLIVQLKEVNENASIVAMTNIKEPELINCLKTKNLIGYVYQTLNDPSKEIFNCTKFLYKGCDQFP